ncbi:S41 family peptidase [Silanimonas sp.]|uniref:S41 family peptidase n=1 Tax=Silanimonas sp. TaxID=1929290 RepID=UPI0037C7FA55
MLGEFGHGGRAAERGEGVHEFLPDRRREQADLLGISDGAGIEGGPGLRFHCLNVSLYFNKNTTPPDTASMNPAKFLFIALCFLIGSAAACQAAPAGDRFTAAQLDADMDALEAGIGATHPKLAHSVDPQALKAAIEGLRPYLVDGLDRDGAWRALSTLNAVFADGHLFVGFPSWRDEVAAHRAQGGKLFPFEVAVDADGTVRVLAELGGAPSDVSGRVIASINGDPADAIARRLLAHVHGDSPRFRAGILSQRWWFYYWKLVGDPSHFDIRWVDASESPLRREASAALPSMLAAEDDFDQQFQFELLPGGAARLAVKTFAWHEPERFFGFTRQAFERMHAAGTHTLLIDLRGNGGGDDSMWMQGLMPYLADERYRWASHYTKRVLRPDPAKGERIGDVVEGTVETWTPAQLDHPLRFHGRVAVLVGTTTYSSAVLFANTMQDFGFATIIGEGASVRSTQSGGVQAIVLPNTGLTLWSPRFILTRPSGRAEPEWLTPDHAVADDPLQPGAMVDAALAEDAAMRE